MANKGWGCGSIIGVILILIFIGSLIDKNKKEDYQSKTNTSTSNQFSPKPKPLKETAIELVKIKDFNWHKGGFGNIMIADFTIDNKSPYDIKDITVTCTHRSKSETKIDITKGTIYDVIKAGKTKKFNKINLGFVHSQSSSCNCEITNLELYYGTGN